MPNSGQVVVSFPVGGADEATALITGQTAILATSLVEAWLFPNTATVDHSIDEHVVEYPRVIAGNLIAGTGFTIYVVTRNVALRGHWNVAWAWS